MAVVATYNSSNYVGKDGRNLSLTIEQLYTDIASNTSTIKWTLSTNGGAVTYYDTFCFIKINGNSVYFSNGNFSAAGYDGWIGSRNHPIDTDVWIDATGNEYTCAKWGFSTSGTLTVNHDYYGYGNVNVTFLVGCFYYVVKDCGGYASLPESIDRVAPIIVQNPPRNVTYNSCNISAYSQGSVNCSKWWYRKKLYTSSDWEGWVTIDSSGIEKSASITGLRPNTEYNFQWSGRKATNGLDGYSGYAYIKTQGASKLHTASNVHLDVTSPALKYTMTAYSASFYHKLTIEYGNNSIVINIGKKDVGRKSYSYTFTSAQVTTLLGWIGKTGYSVPASSISLILDTYADSGYSSKIGSSSTLSNAFGLFIDRSNTLPTLTVDGYEDTNSATIASTGNKLYIVPGSSTVRINGIKVNTKFGATITSIIAKSTNDNKTKTIISNYNSTTYTGNFNWGTISADYACFIEITVTDSRGNTATQSILLKIYKKGTLIKATEYNHWYDTLNAHFSAKRHDGTYFITGSSSSGFNLPAKKAAGKSTLGSDLSSTAHGIYKHAVQLSNTSYYWGVTTAVNNAITDLKNITKDIISATTNPDKPTIIKADLKTKIDADLAAINNIILFTLTKG